MILTCFAPIAKEEIRRILEDNGYFLLINPHRDHLIELKEAIYDNPYENVDIEIEGLKLIEKRVINQRRILNQETIQNLFMMTPYFYKTSLQDKDKLNEIDELEITFSFNLYLYKKMR